MPHFNLAMLMRSIGRIILFVLYVGVPLGTAAVVFSVLRAVVFDARDPSMTDLRIFDTETAPNLSGIARGLEEQGFIKDAFAFRMLARFQGKDTLIKAGEYELSPAMAPQEILRKMVAGEVFQRRATIKEGMTIREIGAVLEEAGITNARSFIETASDQIFLADQGVAAVSFEGYLFPETYNFRRNAPAKKIISAMYDELKKRWSFEWNQRAQILDMTIHQILTLASIIEKESGNFEEQPVISSVFHNRLKKGMRLQADPTVIYGIKDFNGNITKRDLLTETPYNTYIIEGLPPGPIANPGISAIKAALYPAETDFLFFVGNGAGKHVFSHSLSEHNEAVNRYQRGGSDRTLTIEDLLELADTPAPGGATGKTPSVAPTP